MSDRRIVEVRHYEDLSGVDGDDVRYADGAVHTRAGMSWAEARELAQRAGGEQRDDELGAASLGASTLTKTSPEPGRNGSATSSGPRSRHPAEGRCTPDPEDPPAPTYPAPQQPPARERPPRRRRRLARRLAAATLIVAPIALVTTGCPPPNPQRWAPCENVTAAPHRCSIEHVISQTDGSISFIALASTSEPPTGIKFHVLLERRVPDPADPRGYSYVLQWHDYVTSDGKVQALQWGGVNPNYYAPFQKCIPGIYHWRLETIFFSAQNTTFTAQTADHVVT